jgi:hypothetical protein
LVLFSAIELNMRGDGQWVGPPAALEGLEHMPPLPQFSSEWRNVAGRCGSAVQRYYRLRPGPVLTHEKIGHVMCCRLANAPLQPRRLMIAPTAVGRKRMFGTRNLLPLAGSSFDGLLGAENSVQ